MSKSSSESHHTPPRSVCKVWPRTMSVVSWWPSHSPLRSHLVGYPNAHIPRSNRTTWLTKRWDIETPTNSMAWAVRPGVPGVASFGSPPSRSVLSIKVGSFTRQERGPGLDANGALRAVTWDSAKGRSYETRSMAPRTGGRLQATDGLVLRRAAVSPLPLQLIVRRAGEMWGSQTSADAQGLLFPFDKVDSHETFMSCLLRSWSLARYLTIHPVCAGGVHEKVWRRPPSTTGRGKGVARGLSPSHLGSSLGCDHDRWLQRE